MNKSDKKRQQQVSVKNEITSLLPFYITGRLGLRDQIRVEQWLEENAAGQKALENAYDEQRACINANETISSPSNALGQLLRDIDKEPAQGWSYYVSSNALASASNWLMSWLNWIPSTITWAAVAALLLVTLTQSALLWRRDEPPAPPPASPASPDKSAKPNGQTITALILFAPGVGIDRISSLLTSLGATIENGPRQDGSFIIMLHAKKTGPSPEQRLKDLAKRIDLVSFIVSKEEIKRLPSAN